MSKVPKPPKFGDRAGDSLRWGYDSEGNLAKVSEAVYHQQRIKRLRNPDPKLAQNLPKVTEEQFKEWLDGPTGAPLKGEANKP